MTEIERVRAERVLDRDAADRRRRVRRVFRCVRTRCVATSAGGVPVVEPASAQAVHLLDGRVEGRELVRHADGGGRRRLRRAGLAHGGVTDEADGGACRDGPDAALARAPRWRRSRREGEGSSGSASWPRTVRERSARSNPQMDDHTPIPDRRRTDHAARRGARGRARARGADARGRAQRRRRRPADGRRAGRRRHDRGGEPAVVELRQRAPRLLAEMLGATPMTRSTPPSAATRRSRWSTTPRSGSRAPRSVWPSSPAPR